MYKINQTTIKDEKNTSIITYGISYGNSKISDISTDKSKVEKLVSLCNKLNLSPAHINDVIEDFLVDFEI